MTSRSLGRRAGLLALLSTALVSSPAAAAGAGDLDPSFAGDGTLVTAVQGTAREVLVVPGAQAGDAPRVVVAGRAADGFFLARLTAAGAPDPLFNAGRPAEAAPAQVRDVAGAGRDGDGRLLVAGTTPGDGYAVARYLPNGTLDRTYGTDGVASGTELGAGVNDVLVQPDGRVVLAGDLDLGGGDVIGVLIRLDAAGTFDAAFGTDGFVTLDHRAYAAAAAAGGGTLVAAGPDLVRVPGNGRNPTVSAGNGFVADDVAVDAGGRALLAGPGLRVQRRVAAGGLDAAFGTAGLAAPAVAVPDAAAGGRAAVDAQGRVVVAGETAADFALARFLPTGAPDPAFGGGDGVVTTDLGTGTDGSTAVAVQPDGAILVAGRSGGHVAVARYLGAASAATTTPAETGTEPAPAATPAPDPQPVATPAPQQEVLGQSAESAVAFRLHRGQTLRVSRGALTFAVSCPPTGCRSLRFKLRLIESTKTVLTTRGRRATVVSGGRVRLRLERKALALLRRHGRLTAVLVAVGPDGGAVSSPKLTVRRAKR